MAARRPPTEHIDEIYRRLLADEPDAPSDLIALLLDPLITELQRAYPAFPDLALLSDVVTDSLLKFVQEPQRYQAEKRSLWGYLKMDAQGDLLNLWRALRRRSEQEVTLEAVALTLPDGNSSVEEAVLRRLLPTTLPEELDAVTILAQLRNDIASEQDWNVIMLMAQGERKTTTFATVLGIADLPIADQRERVKQTKDRLRLMLKRWGEKIYER